MGRRKAFWEKREEHVPRIVLSHTHHGGRIGDIAGEVGRDVRGYECHTKQLAGTLKATGKHSSI